LQPRFHSATGKTVAWRNAGANSAVASQLRDYVVPNIEERDFTHVLIAVGTNDAKNFLSRSRFKKGFGGLLYAVHTRWPEARIYWSPVIDMTKVPALPPVLGFILGLRVQIINAMGVQLCRERHATAIEPLPVEGEDGFAIDGFHANKLGYEHWADHASKIMLDEDTSAIIIAKIRISAIFQTSPRRLSPGSPNGLIRCKPMATRTRIKKNFCRHQSRLFCKPAIHLS
jgi:lysophospholipase L1-like esterase